MKNITTNTLTTILLVAILCVLIEGLLFENGFTFMALLGGSFIYFSMKRQKKKMFWLGIIFLVIAVLSMWSLRILLVATVIYILWKMRKGEPIEIKFNTIHPNKRSQSRYKNHTNKVFRFDDSPIESYAWKDMHLQNLVGELVIDATETILPKGTSFISIRQGFGKVTIYIPYEIPVRIHFNTVIGEATLLKEKYPRLWNDEALSINDGYHDEQTPTRELIITTSSFFGDLEVVRK
ncbi:MAG: hypothetical protein KBT36_16375 [Kurthia sp.]|nr:hypothetical protein [Candidatus Kurthia equi]